ncbi:VOC family protein [Rhodococcus sp. SGAir0479]|uniref:VOC family protein n=1 Tax=Rhodococcus sp. SGAir0479 TaxID=2567884 RepID=UPI0010CD6A81|nr:VOC family protein [Rhodococcus sp. SGAir0479]QCQ92140.1 VOC family protein [Rhodococcus sp. SGAir0479]
MPTRETAPVGAPCWIDVTCSDVDRAAAFYRELFGWTAESSGEEYGGYVMFFSDGKPIAGMMAGEPGQPGTDTWTTYLATDDVDRLAEAVTTAGGQVMVGPMTVPAQGRMAVFVDTSGGVVGAWQPDGHKGFGLIAESGAPAWFELVTKDYEAALPFYRDVFGWELSTLGDSDEFRYSTGRFDGEDLVGVFDASRALPAEVPSHWQMFVQVDDTDAAVARVRELDGAVLTRPWDTEYGRMAQVADPNGARFMLSGPVVAG